MQSIRLSKRQLEVVSLVSDALTNKEIASRLNLSEATVDRHIVDISHRLSPYGYGANVRVRLTAMYLKGELTSA